MTIRGTLKRLSEGRLVFIGKSEADPGHVYIGFRNKGGEDTKLKLSNDGKEALHNLLDRVERDGLGVEEFPAPDHPPRMAWVLADGEAW